MSDSDPLVRRIRAAGGSGDDEPDLDAVFRRARHRRASRYAGGVVAAVAVVAAAVFAIDGISGPRTIRFAESGGASPSAMSDAAVAVPPDSEAPSPPTSAGTSARTEPNGTQTDDVPEGSLVAVPNGFVIVTGNVPATVWFSHDGRTWAEQPADGLASDLVSDVAATPDGVVLVLDVTPALWVSDDAGRSWQRSDLPPDVGSSRPTAVTADASSRLVGGARSGQAFLFASPREDPSAYARIDGDFAHEQSAQRVVLASSDTATVMVAGDGTVWRVGDDLEVSSGSDTAFDGARVTAVAGIGRAGFIALATDDGDDPDAEVTLWTSSDGQTWSRDDDDVPPPACAQLARSGGVTLAAGSPCGVDAGWQVWLRTDASDWSRIE